MTAAVTRLPRKRVLMGLLVLFIAGNFLSAVADSYQAMLLGQIVAALCHGAFFGIGSVVAAALVSADKKAGAIAIMFTGLTAANGFGVPFGALSLAKASAGARPFGPSRESASLPWLASPCWYLRT